MTFLATSKMSPALAARVEASVRGRRSSAGRPKRRLSRSIARVAFATAILSVLFAVVRTEQHARREREAARAALLELVRAESASLTEDDKQSVAKVETWLVRLASPQYEGDFVADDLKKPELLRATLARPAVYLRGGQHELRNTAAIADVAAASTKDALLSCLVEPPSSRAEKAVLAKVRASQGAAPNVKRVDDARVGLPLLLPEWQDEIAAAGDIGTIRMLRARFAKAPIAAAKQALRAEILIAAIDDAASGNGPTELDGARAHDVRVAVVDLRTSKVLLRLNKHVDPSWITQSLRPQYASSLDACALAYDIRESLTK